jgi:hypothetical protein
MKRIKIYRMSVYQSEELFAPTLEFSIHIGTPLDVIDLS